MDVTHEPMQGSDLASGQMVTFKIDDRNFGIDVTRVREIRGWQPVTPLPNTDADVLGVLNLRGLVVPIYDLRAKFGIGRSTAQETNVVIVVDVEDRTIGLVADSVSDIVSVDAGEITPSPNMTRLIRDLVVKDSNITAVLSLSAILH